MTAPILAAGIFCIAVTVVQLTSIAIAIGRFRRCARRAPPPGRPVGVPVSIVRPLCGIDNYAADTLSSTFQLDYPDYEILFCVAAAKDAVVPLVTTLMTAHPGASARLLVGDDRVSPNPKLNNVVKGWRAARHDWIIIADSNVLMPRDYIEQLFASRRHGYRARRLAADRFAYRTAYGPKSECAFLNTYQAQLAIYRRHLRFRFRPRQDHAVAARRSRRRRRHRGARQRGRRRRRGDQGGAQRRSQGAAGRSAAGATAWPAQRRRRVEPPITLGAAAARQLSALFSARNPFRRRTADDRRGILGGRIGATADALRGRLCGLVVRRRNGARRRSRLARLAAGADLRHHSRSTAAGAVRGRSAR